MKNTMRKEDHFQDIDNITRQVQKILLVDDDRTLRAVLTLQLEQMGYEVIEAVNGREAFDILETHSDTIDIILLDREMPVMDGMEFISKIKTEARFSKIPVIMATGSGQPEQISQGIEAGVFYYLVKPINYDVLSTLVSTAMREALRTRKMAVILKKQKDSFSLLSDADFTIVTVSEAEHLSMMLANCYEEPEKVYPGLLALMVNAIEHGNLGIGFQEKSYLLSKGTTALADEINRRLMLADNIDKQVKITYRKTLSEQVVTVTDDGQGFDWQGFLQLDPARVFQGNGRGIAIARTQSFDRLEYNELGNSVVATIYTKWQQA